MRKISFDGLRDRAFKWIKSSLISDAMYMVVGIVFAIIINAFGMNRVCKFLIDKADSVLGFYTSYLVIASLVLALANWYHPKTPKCIFNYCKRMVYASSTILKTNMGFIIIVMAMCSTLLFMDTSLPLIKKIFLYFILLFAYLTLILVTILEPYLIKLSRP